MSIFLLIQGDLSRFQGRKQVQRGDQGDLPASAVFSDSVSLKYSIWQRVRVRVRMTVLLKTDMVTI